MAGSSATSQPPLLVAGKSGLLKLVREGGTTRWTFLDAAPTSQPEPSSQAGGKAAASRNKQKAAAEKKAVEEPKAAAAEKGMEKTKMGFDHGSKHGECVGTLRWSEGDAFPVIARWPLSPSAPAPKLTGTGKFQSPGDVVCDMW